MVSRRIFPLHARPGMDRADTPQATQSLRLPDALAGQKFRRKAARQGLRHDRRQGGRPGRSFPPVHAQRIRLSGTEPDGRNAGCHRPRLRRQSPPRGRGMERGHQGVVLPIAGPVARRTAGRRHMVSHCRSVGRGSRAPVCCFCRARNSARTGLSRFPTVCSARCIWYSAK